MRYIAIDADRALKEREAYEQEMMLRGDVVNNFCDKVRVDFDALLKSEIEARQLRAAKRAAEAEELENC